MTLDRNTVVTAPADPLDVETQAETSAIAPARAGYSHINAGVYAVERARGATHLEALRRAGSKVRTPSAASRVGGRLEAKPWVRALIEEARRSMIVTSDRMWRAGFARLGEIIEDDDSTNFDVVKVMELLARIRGEIAPVKVNLNLGATLTAFCDMTRKPAESPLDADSELPHVDVPDGKLLPAAVAHVKAPDIGFEGDAE